MTVLDAPLSEFEQEEMLSAARQLVMLREQKKKLVAREGELNKYLMPLLERAGEPYGEAGQHRMLKFPRPIRGIAALIRQAKVSQSVDTTKAEAIARQKGIYDRLFLPVPTLDQEAVLVAREENLITDAEFAEIFPSSTSFALVMDKAKK